MPLPAVLAHPLTEASGLPVPPVFVATLAVLAIGVVALLPTKNTVAGEAAPEYDAPAGLTRAGIAWRVLGLFLLTLAIATGRLGANRPTDSLASALVVGAGWPLLIVLSVIGLRVWERINPFDTLARLLGSPGAPDAEPPRADVRLALIPSLGLVWYLSAFGNRLLPRSVGAAVALYTLFTLAGCLVAGRRAWLDRAEVFGLFYGWVGRLRRGRLVTWSPPLGAELVVGVLAGGLLFGAIRVSALWSPVWFRLYGWNPNLLGVGVFAAVAAALLWGLARRERRLGGTGSVTAAAVPATAGIAVALSLAGGQLLHAVQLLPILASDPFGRGWNLFGTAGWRIDLNPLGDTLHVTVQVLILVAGGVAGGLVARRRSAALAGQTAGRVRALAILAIAVLSAAGVLAVTAV